MLILHSDDDGSVPLQQARDMADALAKAKAPHRFVQYEKKGHMRVTEEVIKETREFIEKVSQAKPSHDKEVQLLIDEVTLFDAGKVAKRIPPSIRRRDLSD